jgi:D-alanyl-D-alanine carboxypeptidase (penicillin-binding protein 5/6)
MSLRIRPFATALFLLFSSVAAIAAIKAPIPAPPIIGAKSYVLIDASTGAELASLEPDLRLAPASLTKLMTAYAVFRALRDDQITLDEETTISEEAWRTEGSRMFIEVGTRVSVQDLLLGMIVQSGNDASVALAEHVAGTEPVFADLMNLYAAELGMQGTSFRNSSGMPDADHYSTARDLAILARRIIAEFPEYYKWYSVREFTYNGITQPNRNNLLWRDDSVDGMKTGNTDDAGYCLVSSASRDGMRVVSVVLGTASAEARIDGSQALINYGFRFFETRLLYRAGETLTQVKVWKSATEFTQLGLADDLLITIPRGSFDAVESVLNVPVIIEAPVAQGQPLAELQVNLDGENLLTEPLRALAANPAGSFWQRTTDTVELWFE